MGSGAVTRKRAAHDGPSGVQGQSPWPSLELHMNVIQKLSAVEHLKIASDGLRGRLAEELAEGGIQVSEEAYNLLKFHGSYEQFDRDTATLRKQHGMEKE